MPAQQNRLANEKSPYLLQHTHNPVDWYPWGEEAFEKAEQMDKPIFLSIGYSTCHWCHVMAHESFEDEMVAQLMNEAFICIKVDREERPDIDHIYMAVCQMMTGRGGWPLTIIMTPDKKPFFAGTYFPKEHRYGHMGMLELIPRVQELWQNERDKILDASEKITTTLQRSITTPAEPEQLDARTLDHAYYQFQQQYDPQYAGFGSRPKFPIPHNLLFLLRYDARDPEKQALEMVETTLDHMRAGGIYDQVGFGFHRYSTDEQWLLPHFEKMLYDQAMLAIAYTEAYTVSKKETYRQTVAEILTYVSRDMTHPDGGFYSAEDADSEGEEGKFYIWTESEIRAILTEEEAESVIRHLNVKKDGNYREEATGASTGANILHFDQPLDEIDDDFLETWEGIRQKLFTVREKRIHPLKDDKILTDWNGLMIAAFAKAGRVFHRSDYIEAAQRAVRFVLNHLRTNDGQLLHRYREGEAGLPACVDDYAFLIWGLIELYQAMFDLEYLAAALDLNAIFLRNFWDTEGGGFYFTAEDSEKLLARRKENYDGAIPSGNSVALLNLLRLARITGRPELQEKADQMLKTHSRYLVKTPFHYAQWLVGLDFVIGPAYEVVLVGNLEDEMMQEMIQTMYSKFLPNMVMIIKTSTNAPRLTELIPITQAQTSINGQPTAYVCQNYICNPPTTDMNKVLRLLENDNA